MRLHEIPPELVGTIAEEAIAKYQAILDQHGRDEERAKAAAIVAVVDGAAVPTGSAETIYGVEMLSGVEVLERLRRLHAANVELKRRDQEQRPAVEEGH